MARRKPMLFALLLLATLPMQAGCLHHLWPADNLDAKLDELPEPDIQLIGDVSRPHGVTHTQVEGIALVKDLEGTGENPPPSPQLAVLTADMRQRDVEGIAEILESPDTTMVLVRGLMRPGIQRGDRFDLEVTVPSRNATSSLRNGWMMETRLAELAVLGQQIRKGHTLGLAKGPILVDPSAGENDPGIARRGRILGGGIALKDRPLGLIIDRQFESVPMAQRLGAAINRRFHAFENGTRREMANPKTKDYVELAVHPRYKDNIGRYLRVIGNLPVEESPTEQQSRVEILAKQLRDPLTAASAAIRLEALGNDTAIAALSTALNSPELEVRFYAAEALAYLDHGDAIAVLADTMREEPAFRIHALAALGAMEDIMASEALRALLSEQSAETRYGAFRALWAMNPHDPLIAGERLPGGFSMHQLPVDGPAMVHVTRSFRPEIVLFGRAHRFRTPLYVEAGRHILVKSDSDTAIVVSRIAPGEATQRRVVPNDVAAVVHAIAELDGTYPDVVQALQAAESGGLLNSRFAVEALPVPGRTPKARTAENDREDTETPRRIGSPQPDLFPTK